MLEVVGLEVVCIRTPSPCTLLVRSHRFLEAGRFQELGALLGTEACYVTHGTAGFARRIPGT